MYVYSINRHILNLGCQTIVGTYTLKEINLKFRSSPYKASIRPGAIAREVYPKLRGCCVLYFLYRCKINKRPIRKDNTCCYMKQKYTYRFTVIDTWYYYSLSYFQLTIDNCLNTMCKIKTLAHRFKCLNVYAQLGNVLEETSH